MNTPNHSPSDGRVYPYHAYIRSRRERHAGTTGSVTAHAACLSVWEVLGSAPPLAEEGERVSGGEDSGARPAEGSIGLNSIWVKLTQRREEQRTLVGEVADARHARELFHEIQTWTFFLCYFYFQRKGTTVDFFFRASGDTSPTNEELIW